MYQKFEQEKSEWHKRHSKMLDSKNSHLDATTFSENTILENEKSTNLDRESNQSNLLIKNIGKQVKKHQNAKEKFIAEKEEFASKMNKLIGMLENSSFTNLVPGDKPEEVNKGFLEVAYELQLNGGKLEEDSKYFDNGYYKDLHRRNSRSRSKLRATRRPSLD